MKYFNDPFGNRGNDKQSDNLQTSYNISIKLQISFYNKIIRFNQCITITRYTTSNFIVYLFIVTLQSTIRNEYSMIVIFA